MHLDTVVNLLGKVPWELLIAVIALPILRRQTAKIKNDDLRAAYVDIVRYVEQRFGSGNTKRTSAQKKATAVSMVSQKGLKVDDLLLEAVVNEVTGGPGKVGGAAVPSG